MPKFIVGARLHDYGKGSPDELFGRVTADGFVSGPSVMSSSSPSLAMMCSTRASTACCFSG